jgi:hypothetical protein
VSSDSSSLAPTFSGSSRPSVAALRAFFCALYMRYALSSPRAKRRFKKLLVSSAGPRPSGSEGHRRHLALVHASGWRCASSSIDTLGMSGIVVTGPVSSAEPFHQVAVELLVAVRRAGSIPVGVAGHEIAEAGIAVSEALVECARDFGVRIGDRTEITATTLATRLPVGALASRRYSCLIRLTPLDRIPDRTASHGAIAKLQSFSSLAIPRRR